MNFRTVIITGPTGVLAMLEHAGEGREANDRRPAAEIQDRLHVHDRLGPGGDDETVGSGRAHTVEQGEHRDRLCVGSGPLDPEFLEAREFLVTRLAGVDRQAARREPVVHARSEGAKVTRAQERRQLVEVARLIQRIVDTETGEAQVARHRPDRLVAAVVEERRGKIDELLLRLAHLMHLHRLLEQPARVVELELEGKLLRLPPRAVGIEADIAILAVIIGLQPARRAGRSGRIGSGRERLGARLQRVEGEFGPGSGQRQHHECSSRHQAAGAQPSGVTTAATGGGTFRASGPETRPENCFHHRK